MLQLQQSRHDIKTISDMTILPPESPWLLGSQGKKKKKMNETQVLPSSQGLNCLYVI